MYTLFNPNQMWAQQQIPMAPPPGQPVYYAPAYIVNGAPTTMPMGQSQPLFYPHPHPHPPPPPPHPSQAHGWFPVASRAHSNSSDDDVFIRDTPASSETSSSICEAVPAKKTKVVQCQTDESCFRRVKKPKILRPSRQTLTRRKLSAESLPDGLSSNGSPRSDESLMALSDLSSRTTSPIGGKHKSRESSLDATRPSFVPSARPCARQVRLDNDMALYDVFSTSLFSAINGSDSGASNDMTQQKTSSPIQEEESTQPTSSLINIEKLKNVHNRFLTSVSSERCMRFSQNGWEVELDSESTSGVRNVNVVNTILPDQDPTSIRREDFLKILELEREKLKKCVLPKYAPKMNCKFCKNNGEDPEVYSKHRLHFNEKTVCPLLRHYVCRLCNSTGDFAHTIRHCPFNTRYDNLAWKATFL